MSDLGNKQIMARNLRRYMDQKEVSRKDICEALGLSYMTVSDWINGKTYPRIDKIEMLANYFGVSKADLVEERNPRLPVHPSPYGHYRIPVLTTVAAGKPIYAEEDIIEWIDYDKDPGDHIRACRIEGNSMIPRIQDGDTIIFNTELGWEDGDVVVATVNGDHATCKRIRRYTDGIALLSDNTDIKPMYYSKQEVEDLPVKIIGRVMEVRGRL